MFDPSKIFKAMDALKEVQKNSKIITNRGVLSTLFSNDIYDSYKENPKIINTFNSIMGNSENMEHYANFLTGRFYSGRNLNDIKAYNNALNFIADTYGAEKFSDFFWGQQLNKAGSFDDIENTLNNLSRLKENLYPDNKLLNSPGFSSEGLDNYLRKNFTNDWAQEIKQGIGERLPDLKSQIRNYKSFNDFSNKYNDFLGLKYPMGIDTLNRDLQRISNISDNDINNYLAGIRDNYDPRDWDRIKDYAFEKRNRAGETYKQKQDLFTRQGYKNVSNELYVKKSEKVADLLRKDLKIKNTDDLVNFTSTIAERAYLDLGLDKTNFTSKLSVMLENLDGTKGGFYNQSKIQINLADKWNTLARYYTAKASDVGGDEAAKYMRKMKDSLYNELLTVVGHEYRHAWQDYVDNGQMKTDIDWHKYKTDYDYYYNSRIEKDARKYGAEFAERYKDTFRTMFDAMFEKEIGKGNTNTRKLRRGEGTYRTKVGAQEWDAPNASNSPIEVQDTSRYKNIRRGEGRHRVRTNSHEWDVPNAPNSPIGVQDSSRYKNVKRGDKRYRTKTDAPRNWNVDTGNRSPVGKHDVSRNTRYRNAKLNKGQKSLRPAVTMNGNNVDFDSIYNHSTPRKINKAPEPETYSPQIGDNIIDNETGERYVLKEIDHADPSLDIHNDTYYYDSPNGDRITRQTPIDPNNSDGHYSLGDKILDSDDVYRINNSFEDLRMYTDDLEKAKGQLYKLKDDFDNGADNLNEIYEMEKSVRSLESKVANARMQIEEDNNRYNSNGDSVYEINEKTQRYMDTADKYLKDYSETKYVNDYEEVFKEVKPRQFINTIEPGVDSAIEVINNTTVENNIKTRTRTRGKKKNAELTGRGNKKRVYQGSSRKNKSASSKSKGRKKLPINKKRGKSKLRAVGRNGKVLSNIPRKMPLSKKDIIKTAANIVVNEAASDTANTIIKNIDDIDVPDVDNAPHPDSPDIPSPDNPIPDPDQTNTPEAPEFDVPDGYGDPSTWTDEDIADMADGDPDLYEELLKRREQTLNTGSGPEVNTGPQGEPIPPKSFSEKFDPNDPNTWTRDDLDRMNNPSAWTDDDIRRLADGDADYADELINRKKTGSGGPSNKLPDEFDFNDAPIPERNKIDTPDTKMFDEDGLPQGIKKMDIAMTGLNIIGAVGDYKSARREGHGVVSSAVRAGVKLAVDEALGWWALPIGIVKTLPGVAIKGADMLYKENRRMNSAANYQVFGDAQFMDTQQLATMRQSGMEMAKMAQYNLQQTLMGSEAKYLHR